PDGDAGGVDRVLVTTAVNLLHVALPLGIADVLFNRLARGVEGHLLVARRLGALDAAEADAEGDVSPNVNADVRHQPGHGVGDGLVGGDARGEVGGRPSGRVGVGDEALPHGRVKG